MLAFYMDDWLSGKFCHLQNSVGKSFFYFGVWRCRRHLFGRWKSVIREFFLAHQFLEFHESFNDAFGPWRTSRHIDIHRNKLIHTLDHAIGIKYTAGGCAGTHGHDPFRFRHLFVDANQNRHHFDRYPTGNNQ